MVVTAKWVAANLPPQAVVAAHDIGALGYFDHHRLIDLAGLVSPEVIPFIRNEAQLSSFLDAQHANYLVAFPAFYPKLTTTLQPVFTSGGAFAPGLGQKNMTVYLWARP
jgi:ABC-type Zn2+ transport system substrate-binding protein/surface adhesin